jgi:hypothetical protein
MEKWTFANEIIFLMLHTFTPMIANSETRSFAMFVFMRSITLSN